MTRLCIYHEKDSNGHDESDLFHVTEDGVRELRYIRATSPIKAIEFYCENNGLDIDFVEVEDLT